MFKAVGSEGATIIVMRTPPGGQTVRMRASMNIIPVIDLKAGLVVRGVAGRREEYRPIVSQLVSEPSPRAVARALVQRFNFRQVYIADLDAIAGQLPNLRAYQDILACGLTPWIDAGVATVEAAQSLLDLGKIIVGLESLRCLAALPRIVDACSAERVVFSLDLKGGRPITSIVSWHDASPDEIAVKVMDIGIRRLIVLDLADVGVGQGTGTLGLVERLHARHPQVEITAGGGVRGIDDLRHLATAGCASALVASALHDGRLTPEEVRWLQQGE